MKLETVKLADLKPLEKNVRRHSDKQIQELAKSVTQFGVTRPMVIDENGNILIGNGLYYALKSLGKDTAECYRISGLSEKKKKKLILSDNKIYSLGSDDYDEIQNYINSITEDGDFDIAGFDKEVLEQMTATDEDVEEAINEYGKVTDEYIRQEEAPQVREESNVSADVHNEPNDTTNYAEPVNNTSEPVRRSVICPKCGEVIYID